MRLKVIVNPAAGRGRVRRVAAALEVFRRSGAEFDVEESRNASHLTDLGRGASAQGFDRVIVCGGDGSVHHAVRQFHLDRSVLGIIPLGSGDDFAGTLGIPSNPARAAEMALSESFRSVDVGLANGVRFLIAASIGFDAAVARYASDNVTAVRGPAVYAYATLKMLRRFEPIRVAIIENDEIREQELMFAVVANAPRYGGGIRIAPTATVDDGLLDLYVISPASKRDLLTTLPLAYFGRHTRRRYVRSSRGTSFRFDSEPRQEIFADGELVTTTPVTIGIASEKLRVAALSR